MLHIYCIKCFSDNCIHWNKKVIYDKKTITQFFYVSTKTFIKDIIISCNCGCTPVNSHSLNIKNDILYKYSCKKCNNKMLISKNKINDSMALILEKYPRKKCTYCKGEGKITYNIYRKM